MVAISPAARPLRIVLPGGSGQVGQMLARYFQERGHRVAVLTRGPYAAPWQTIYWDGEHPGPWIEALEGADVCIHLAGRSMNCRQTTENRQVIYTSRIRSTRLLHQIIAGLADPPKVWMNASASAIQTRIPGPDGADLPLQEERLEADHEAMDVPWTTGRDFTARVARDWEAAFFEAEMPRTRRVALRTGVVFSPVPGNVFHVFSNLVRISLGGAQGSGRQFVPWIHETDYARAVEFLIEREDLDGPFHLAAPNPLPNRDFMAALREAWEMPNGIPAPAFAVRLGAWLMGSNADLVLESCRAVPRRLMEAGFEFLFPEWPDAAEDLVRQWKNRE